MNSLIKSTNILKLNSNSLFLSKCNYSVLSQKKFDKIKNKRDKEQRLLKEEKEKFFSEQSSVSVEDLDYPQVLNNVKEKYQKYGAISNHLVAALFRKSKTSEELFQSLAFYKRVGNKSSEFFKPSQKTYIFESFLKNNQIPLFSEMLIHSDKFQIFPQMNVFVKCVSQLLSKHEGEVELAASLLSTYQLRNNLTVPDSFLNSLGKRVDAEGASLKVIDLLKIYPVNLKLGITSDLGKYIIRSAYLEENKEEIYKVLVEKTDKFDQFDVITKSEYVTFEIIANHNVESHKYSNEIINNENVYNQVVKNLEKLLNNENTSENTKNNIKRSISNFTIDPKLKNHFNL
ncbi:hypothetical protein DICPUDRAFT_34221 [Dictyostelium purpureum]|uniref:Uncharacterized protein n=1 Tax=Dictyostelium purpureum TaxID=5786 RepID=F0ZMB2_DICPU|nr:uncharacterized protein DICPUDRAFT_34221 [Dictyostelium purpureum]EGC34929.1 hypothetical protein DICPUDRAFT_34221 [Dictyostelium purpureum]|eukprot:XP_003288562.1 hypothetical protein DICPUDRAFT_34221 [Dictyostelium purpureum]